MPSLRALPAAAFFAIVWTCALSLCVAPNSSSAEALDRVASHDAFVEAVRTGEEARDRGDLLAAHRAADRARSLAVHLESEYRISSLLFEASVARGEGKWVAAEERIVLAQQAIEIETAREAAAGADTGVGSGRWGALRFALGRERGLLAEYRGEHAEATSVYQTMLTLDTEGPSPTRRMTLYADLARVAVEVEAETEFEAAEAAFFEATHAVELTRETAGAWLAILAARRTHDARQGRIPALSAEDALDARRIGALSALLETSPSILDRRARAWALSLRASRYAERNQSERAKQDLIEGLRLAAISDAPETLLRLRAQYGRLLARFDEPQAGLAELEDAVEGWRSIRASRRFVLPEARRFGQSLLRDVVDLRTRLARSIRPRDPVASQAHLLSALATLERLRSTELKDYFQDECVDAYREGTRQAAAISEDSIVLYPVSLEERLELLVAWRDEVIQFTIDVSEETLRQDARDLRASLPDRMLGLYEIPARALYDRLIRPIESLLESREIRTIVFVPGTGLRTIPLASLFDGERFLIERYAIATIPALELVDSQPIAASGNLAFLGGLAAGTEGFDALPHVPGELQSVQDIVGRGSVALDDGFTSDEVQRRLQAQEFNIVHLATHGSFGSTADASYLLARDGRVGLDQIAEWVGAFRYRDRPLDLMVLSACESAVGDENAALGFSGVAVKAGARSALGTLWSVNDEATSRVIAAFYRGMIREGLSRAESLRRAQRQMIEDPDFAHPYFWAPFLLLNAWT